MKKIIATMAAVITMAMATISIVPMEASAACAIYPDGRYESVYYDYDENQIVVIHENAETVTKIVKDFTSGWETTEITDKNSKNIGSAILRKRLDLEEIRWWYDEIIPLAEEGKIIG